MTCSPDSAESRAVSEPTKEIAAPDLATLLDEMSHLIGSPLMSFTDWLRARAAIEDYVASLRSELERLKAKQKKEN